MQDDIKRVAKKFKDQKILLSDQELRAYHEQQIDSYENEYNKFTEFYKRDECYLCGKPFKSISKAEPCLHWLLRRCKFKKKDFSKITERYDFYSITAFLRWVANTETGVKNINNLKGESSERKVFETTIKWKNIEWTLDCSKNDLQGHKGSKTDFPHWHFQMRIDGNQFINFNDYHIIFSKDDMLKIELENDLDSGFFHTFGHGGQGMQEYMDDLADNPEYYIENVLTTSNADEGVVNVQTILMGSEDGISGDKIDEALEMARKTGKTFAYCFQEVLADDEKVSMTTITSPADSVPKIAKRSERKRR